MAKQFGEDIPNNILYPVPHRQFVFSIPILLRVYFKYDRKLLTEFCHCAKESSIFSFERCSALMTEYWG